MNNELSKQLELLRFYKEKGCLDTHYKVLIDYIDELEEKIEKAIEYIKEKVEEDEKCTDIRFINFGEGVDYDLLKILKGSDVDD